jgi:hypothetical protein
MQEDHWPPPVHNPVVDPDGPNPGHMWRVWQLYKGSLIHSIPLANWGKGSLTKLNRRLQQTRSLG